MAETNIPRPNVIRMARHTQQAALLRSWITQKKVSIQIFSSHINKPERRIRRWLVRLVVSLAIFRDARRDALPISARLNSDWRIFIAFDTATYLFLVARGFRECMTFVAFSNLRHDLCHGCIGKAMRRNERAWNI